MNTYFLSLLEPTRSRRKSGCLSLSPKYRSTFTFFSGRLLIEDKPNCTPMHLYFYTMVRKEPMVRLELLFLSMRLWVIPPSLCKSHYSKSFINQLAQKMPPFPGLNLILRLEDRIIDNIIPSWLIELEK
jgi:hypothetical protein